MALAETIEELVNFILKGVNLIDYASIFLLLTINHCVFLITCALRNRYSMYFLDNMKDKINNKLNNGQA